MIDPSTINEVRRLLAEGRLHQGQIAKATGISLGTVHAIARGKRGVGAKMIDPSLIDEVERLLSEGLLDNIPLSYRQIAKITGVSRGTVGNYARGKTRPTRPVDTVWEESIGPYERCLGCGGMVTKPCRVCRTRELMREA